jgi:hypothetical protein
VRRRWPGRGGVDRGEAALDGASRRWTGRANAGLARVGVGRRWSGAGRGGTALLWRRAGGAGLTRGGTALARAGRHAVVDSVRRRLWSGARRRRGGPVVDGLAARGCGGGQSSRCREVRCRRRRQPAVDVGTGASGSKEREVRERELDRGKWVWGSETPAGVGAGAGRGGSVSAELSPAHLQSSNRASQPGRAERLFSVEVGTAQTRGPG